MATPTRTQKKDRFLKYLLYVTILLLGVAAGIAIRHYYNIPMIESINIIDLATLVVTIFLAIYIPGVFDRQMEVRQDKKQLLEHRIEDLQELYRTINMSVQQGLAAGRDRLILDNTLDVAAGRFSTIVTLLEYLKLDDTFSEEIESLRSLVGEHNRLLSAVPAEAEYYSGEVRRQEEKLFNRIDKESSLLVFRISDI